MIYKDRYQFDGLLHIPPKTYIVSKLISFFNTLVLMDYYNLN